jgi:hypothetical protein
MSLFVGTQVQLNIETAAGGIDADPDGLIFMWRTPSASVDEAQQFEYGTDVELVRDNVGQYHVTMLLDMPGLWRFKAISVKGGTVVNAYATADVSMLSSGW